METTLSLSMLNHTIRLARIIYNLLKHSELNSNLSAMTLDCICACEQCCLNIIRTCNSYKNLLTTESVFPGSEPVNFDFCDLVQGLVNAFSSTMSPYCDTDIKFYSKLRPYTPIRIDQKLFEITVLNILYCFVKTRTSNSSDPLKLTIYATETFDNITLHIRGKMQSNSAEKPNKIESVPNSILSTFHNEDDFINLSLALAQKAVSFADGNIESKNLKSSVRYDITFPKFTGNSTTLGATHSYKPSQEMFTETYSEFTLEAMLEKLIDLLSSMGDAIPW